MTIPGYQTIMLPLLRYVGDGEIHRMNVVYEAMADYFELTEGERRELLPSGTQPTINSRVGWARTYLLKAGLLDSPKRGYVQITDAGRAYLDSGMQVLTLKQLYEYEEFREWHEGSKGSVAGANTTASQQRTSASEKALEWIVQKMRQELIGEMVKRIESCSADVFAQLIVDLIVATGYGGTRGEVNGAFSRARGGVSGLIKEDKLGLDFIYVQGKRVNNPHDRSDIQSFVGELHGVRARKGVFITTSHFIDEAREYANTIEASVVLIDGQQLASLMIDHGLGVSVVNTYAVQRIDSGYFM